MHKLNICVEYLHGPQCATTHYSINDWSFEEQSLPASNFDYLGRGNPSLTSIGDDLYLGFGTGKYFDNLDPDGNYAHNDLWVLNIYEDNSVEPLTLLSPPDQEIIDITNFLINSLLRQKF